MYIWSQLPVSFSLLPVIPPEQEGWHFPSPDTLARASANPELEPSPPREPTRTAEVLCVLYTRFWKNHGSVRGPKCATDRQWKRGLCAGGRVPAPCPAFQMVCVLSVLPLMLDKEQATDSLLKWRERTSLTSAGLRTGLSVLSWPLSSHLEKWLISLSLPTESRSDIAVRMGRSGCSQVRPLFKC